MVSELSALLDQLIGVFEPAAACVLCRAVLAGCERLSTPAVRLALTRHYVTRWLKRLAQAAGRMELGAWCSWMR